MFCVIALSLAFIVQRAMPGIDPLRIIQARFAVLMSDDPQLESHTGTRKRDFQVEMGEWWKGTLVFGRGLWFFQTIPNPEQGPGHIAFMHLGYVTYLAQLGLIGLFVYGIYFPLRVIQDGRRLWEAGQSPIVQYVGVMAVATMISNSIGYLMSGSLLTVDTTVMAVLYGAVWALARHAAAGVSDSALEAVERVCCSGSQFRGLAAT
jgi:hypothetical protein